MVLKAINSVLEQTYRAIEIIVIDDGSTDGTDELFPIQGIKYYKIEHSGFPGHIRNIGVDYSICEYIAFLDSDDIWFKDKLEKQVHYYNKHKHTRLLHTKELWIMNGRTISQKKRKHKKCGDVFKESLQGCILGPSTVLMEKGLFNEFNGFNPTIEVGEDYDLWLRITNTIEIDYLDEELITKNAGHGDQLSFKYGYIEPFKIEVLEGLISNFNFTKSNYKTAIESLITKYDIVINGCNKRSNSIEARLYKDKKEYFLQSIK